MKTKKETNRTRDGKEERRVSSRRIIWGVRLVWEGWIGVSTRIGFECCDDSFNGDDKEVVFVRRDSWREEKRYAEGTRKHLQEEYACNLHSEGVIWDNTACSPLPLVPILPEGVIRAWRVTEAWRAPRNGVNREVACVIGVEWMIRESWDWI